MKKLAPEIELPFSKQIFCSQKSTPPEMPRVRFRRFPVNWANPNWKHNAHGIQCRLDWTGAWVYEFPQIKGGIIAYNYEHAYEKAAQIMAEYSSESD